MELEALLFDVFGTVVDWHGSVTKELAQLGLKHPDLSFGEQLTWIEDGSRTLTVDTKDRDDFAREWRAGYLSYT